MEHQTARDSTTGPEKPMGARGATMADTLGASRHDPAAQAERQRGRREPALSERGHDLERGEAQPSERPSRISPKLGLAIALAAIAIRLFPDRADEPRRGRTA
jgi:hypothetical protein